MSMNGQNQEQTELLRNIWIDLKTLGKNLGRRIDQTNGRLSSVEQGLGSLDGRFDSVEQKLDSVEQRLGARIDGTNRRFGVVEEVLRDLGGQQLILTRYVKSVMEREIGDLRERVTGLEARETT